MGARPFWSAGSMEIALGKIICPLCVGYNKACFRTCTRHFIGALASRLGRGRMQAKRCASPRFCPTSLYGTGTLTELGVCGVPGAVCAPSPPA